MIVHPLATSNWKFREVGCRRWRPAVVPGCVHADLRRNGVIPDPFRGTNELTLQWIEERDWEYRTRFELGALPLREEIVELVADGLDTVASVYVNDQLVAQTDNMFLGHRWEVKRWLKRGTNELRVVFGSALNYVRTQRTDFTPPFDYSDPVGGRTRIRKQQCQFGWDWGPRFVTAGIWRDIRLEFWSGNRLADVRVGQEHAADGSVTLILAPEFARSDLGATVRGTVSLAGRVVARIENQRSKIESPQRWWPAGQGAQPLYEIDLSAHDSAGREIGRWRRRIGLRTLVLDRHADEWGESFQFVVNGRPIFAKGANWIPAHAFVATLSREDYARDLRAAAAVHMNMVRVWGGGVYESDDFYGLCDELGLLVWQDFMFACTLYPSDADFLASVRAEARHQVKRLRHHACLALWCGNNEIAQLAWEELQKPRARAGYEALFHCILPEAVVAHDAATPYWPSSPWRGAWEHTAVHATGTQRGDSHFWDVWHARRPVKDYEQWPFRFCSEFGMQSYVSPATQATFCAPGDANVWGPAMENHQKNRAGNQIILDYVSRRYRFPRDGDSLIYLSQLNQAHCMQAAVEHYRRSMPRCMGALYWQLNDCWPVASWSSIEFTGRWKALHYVARRFFAPAIVSAHVPGDETTINGNYRRSTVSEMHLHTVYDAPESTVGTLSWDVFHLDGRRVCGARKRVVLRRNESCRQLTVDLASPIARHGRDAIYVRIRLTVQGEILSEDAIFLAPPRFLELPRARTRVTLQRMSSQRVRLSFRSPVFQHRFAFDFAGLAFEASDNYFDLFPDEPKDVLVELKRGVAVRQLREVLNWRSLVDSYA